MQILHVNQATHIRISHQFSSRIIFFAEILTSLLVKCHVNLHFIAENSQTDKQTER